MHDIKFIRENPDAFDAGLARRGLEPRAGELLALDKEARKFIQALEDLQSRRNASSKLIGQAKAKKDEAEAQRLMKEVEDIKAQMPAAEAEQKKYQDQLLAILEALPNLPAEDVPNGTDEAHNVEARKWGEPARPNHAKEHFDIGEALGQMDFETAAKISGARFVLLSGGLARLERAIANLMLDTHTEEFGYTECAPPVLVKSEALYGTGQLPKFTEDLFHTQSFASSKKIEEMKAAYVQTLNLHHDMSVVISKAFANAPANEKNTDQHTETLNRFEDGFKKWQEVALEFSDFVEQETVKKFGYWLIPTAEVSLTNIVADAILEEETLSRRYTAYTPCFRSEAGSAGRDTRGMIRLHQFSKVELVSITKPEDSKAEHERMTECAEAILKKLELPYRTMTLCTGDMGFGAQKTYDIEVWLPGQNRYREISSCSNCGDFQARRMNARFKRAGAKKPEFVHTLNGSGLAVGRTLVAILENYQQPDGSVAIPASLQPYMGGKTKIEKA